MFRFSLHLNNELKNSSFPLTKSNRFLNILTFFFQFIYNDKNRGRYLRRGKIMAAVVSARSSLYNDYNDCDD